MSDTFFDKDDDEILANFTMLAEQTTTDDAKNNLNAIQQDNDYDSADELLSCIMRNECDSIEKTKFNDQNEFASRSINNTNDDHDSDCDEGFRKAEIAALEAKLAALKSKGPRKKTDRSAENTTKTEPENFCKHNKTPEHCFFCKQSTDALSLSRKEGFGEATTKTPSVADTVKLKAATPSKDLYTCQKKKRVAHGQKEENKEVSETQGTQQTTISEVKRETKKKEVTPKQRQVNKETNTYMHAGISIGNPKVGSLVLEERMKGRKFVNISKISSTIRNNDIEGDWVTLGVLVKKCVQKKAANGKNFSVWELSDLGMGTENQTVGFFLFGETYKEFWKLQVGTVIGLLNPTIMKQDKDRGLSISLDNPKKLMEIGVAKELGVCKGIRRSDSKPCTMFINTKYGDYCEFHLQRAFKKASAGRMELASGGKAPIQKGKGELMKSLKKDIYAGEIHYGGRTVLLHENKCKQNNVKLFSSKTGKVGFRDLMRNDLCLSAQQDLKEIKLKRENDKLLKGGTEEFKQLLVKPTVGSRNLMHMLNGDQEKEEQTTQQQKQTKNDCSSAKNFLKQNKNELLAGTNKQPSKNQLQKKRRLSDADIFGYGEGDSTLQIQNSSQKRLKILDHKREKLKVDKSVEKMPCESSPSLTNRVSAPPKLGRGFNKSSEIEFSDNEEDYLSYTKYTGEESHSCNTSLLTNHQSLANELEKSPIIKKESISSIKAKRKAVAIIQSKGAIQPDDPNDILSKKKSKNALTKIEEKLKKSLGSLEDKNNNKKSKSLLAGVLGKLELNSEEYQKIISQRSRNAGAIRLAEAEQEERYFGTLEKKERMEEKLTSIFEIKVKVYACKQCNYMSESLSKLCKEENHSYLSFKSIPKKFFACKTCNRRTFTYNKPLPVKPCEKCGGLNYAKAPMTSERKGPKIGSETLELRGKEQKFLNSLF